MTETQKRSFFIVICDKLGVPIIAATTVGCLLSASFDVLHGLLFALGIGLEYISWRES